MIDARVGRLSRGRGRRRARDSERARGLRERRLRVERLVVSVPVLWWRRRGVGRLGAEERVERAEARRAAHPRARWVVVDENEV